MNLSLYAAATGMEAQQTNLDVISNNIANVSTSGFKKSNTEFQDLLYHNMRPSGGEAGGGNTVPTNIQLGNGVRVVSTSKTFSQGQIKETNQKLDIAIDGKGFFEVERPDGTRAFTRDGAFKINSDGEIVTSDGLPVQNGWTAVPSNYTDIAVTSNGNVTYTLADGSTQSFQVQLARFANPEGLKAIGRNLFVETEASGAPELGTPDEENFGALHQGFLEMSNVNIVQEMVNMIVAQRAYETNSKAIQTSDQMLGQVNQLKR